MRKIGKTFALFLTVIMAMSCLTLLTVKPADAQAIPKPSVPSFTVKVVDRSYDVPATVTYSTDPFSGKQVSYSSGGYHVTNKTIDVAIQNQHFSPITGNGSTVDLYYTIRMKGHFGNDWQEKSISSIRPADSYCPWPIEYQTTKIHPSASEFTMITFIFGENGLNLRQGDKMDFQVKASAGYNYFMWNTDHMFPIYDGTIFKSYQESDWSPTQTLTISASSSSSTQTPNPSSTPSLSPTVPELSWLVIVSSLLSMLSVAVALRYRKTAN